MKHGPIALIDENLPVVALAPRDHVFEKMLGNIQEAKARGGVGHRRHQRRDEGIRDLLDPATDFLVIAADRAPAAHAGRVRPAAAAARVPHRRPPRRDVDQPRNLAKSVTVE